jgi:predicted TIM-barrel fold metal-dependent hydrolase
MFGPGRLIYGSNWPVSARFAPLDRVHNIVRTYFAAKGESAVRKVFAENARAAYKWVAR